MRLAANIISKTYKVDIYIRGKHKHAVNVTRNPRKRIGYRIAFKPSTNCSIITISRRVPDAQRRRFAGEKGRGRMRRKQIEIQQFGARIVSEWAAATVPVLPVNYGRRPSCGTRCRMVFRGLPNTVPAAAAAETERCGDWIRDNWAPGWRLRNTRGGRRCRNAIDVGLSSVCHRCTLYRVFRDAFEILGV